MGLYSKELKKLLPEKCQLHSRYVVDQLKWQMLQTEKESFVEHIKRDLAYGISNLIVDEKSDSFRETVNAIGNPEFAMDVIVFTPAEWDKYQSDLQNLLTHVRVYQNYDN
jgi:hypothetical protein